MTLKERLQKDLNDSLKAGNQLKRLVLGMVIAAIKNREVIKRTGLSKTISDISELEKQSTLNDDETLEAIAGEVKKRKESFEQYQAGGRFELAQKEKSEIDILLNYLPTQLTEEEIRTEVKKTIAETGAKDIKDMGRVMAVVMARLKGKVEGGLVSRITKEEFAR